MEGTTDPPMREPGGPAPRVAAVEVAFTPHRYPQEELVDAQERMQGQRPAALQILRKVRSSTGIATRHVALPLPDLEKLLRCGDFTETNGVYLTTALELAEQALTKALHSAGIRPDQVDTIISTTVTGLAVPSLEARLAYRVGLRPDVRRVPLFGNGCAGGAAGLARLHDCLLARPGQVAVLLAVEVCSLHYRAGCGAADLVAGSIFGDGAAAVVAVGGSRSGTATGPELVDTSSLLLPDSAEVLGWDIGSHGFRIVLSPQIPALVEKHLPYAVGELLSRHGLATRDVGSWIVHGAGPKVFTAVERAFALPRQALELTRRSVSAKGNLSSVSVLDVLCTAAKAPPPGGTPGLVVAMGPGFAIELALIRW
ncbi:type III polyketide synthase [Streptomyces chrestomyceticus]|uniref:Polyketide synthase n=1 Tax=Streptomyces chrestomyceticus JCM 4735 TaxID=1306181 RepID=A0A7U9Q4M7_9ACTN|nr:type III polyketide synthase [Streptomyces chrestomyceticus]GCD39594.1 polyketide synthase [Streptomyces chrestomyceticus JCM 4735]